MCEQCENRITTANIKENWIVSGGRMGKEQFDEIIDFAYKLGLQGKKIKENKDKIENLKNKIL